MPATYNFELPQGTDLTVPFVLKTKEGVLDLTGYTAAMQVRQNARSETAIDTLTTENDRIVIDSSEGRVKCVFPHAVTETYPAQSLVYDIEIISPGGLVTRFVEGRINVSAEVTRVERTV